MRAVPSWRFFWHGPEALSPLVLDLFRGGFRSKNKAARWGSMASAISGNRQRFSIVPVLAVAAGRQNIFRGMAVLRVVSGAAFYLSRA